MFAHAWAISHTNIVQYIQTIDLIVYSPLWSDSAGISRRLSPSERETLQQQCMWFILMYLEELPPSYLALLPLSIRKEIITRLPIADVCRLEETPFVDGLDLKPYWRSCLSPMRLFYQQQQHLCLDLQRICEDKWGPVEPLLRLPSIQKSLRAF